MYRCIVLQVSYTDVLNKKHLYHDLLKNSNEFDLMIYLNLYMLCN